MDLLTVSVHSFPAPTFVWFLQIIFEESAGQLQSAVEKSGLLSRECHCTCKMQLKPLSGEVLDFYCLDEQIGRIDQQIERVMSVWKSNI